MSLLYISILFFLISIIYASGGFGGGSSYIAILLLANLPVVEVRYLALVCNVVVVATACIYYYKSDLLSIKSIMPLIILSIPAAMLGGMISADDSIYKFIAAASLIVAGLLMLMPRQVKGTTNLTSVHLSGMGGAIGLLSGFVGIGGGIFLSPVLHLAQWRTARVISASASLFILVNSIAGLIGQSINNPSVDVQLCLILAAVVFVGGRIGNAINIQLLEPKKIKLITAILVISVGLRLIITHFM